MVDEKAREPFGRFAPFAIELPTRESEIGRDDGMGMPGWQERFFAVMERNAVHVSDFFSLPNDQVVEIGRQVAI